MSLQTKLTYLFTKNISRLRIISNVVVDFVAYLLVPRRTIDISRAGYVTYLFLCHDVPPHFPRMVKWMRRHMRLHPVLLVAKRGKFAEFNLEHFEQIYTFRSVWQLRRKLPEFRGYDLVYTCGAIAWPMKVGIDYARSPVIFDVKDTYIINYGYNPPQLYMKLDLKNERYTFARADGIVSQSLEAYFALKYYGIAQRPPTLYFPLYCDDDYLVERDDVVLDEELHLVYVGGIYGSTSSKTHFGNEIFFDIIDAFSRQRIHLHLYPAPRTPRSVITEYLDYTQQTPFLHVHNPVSQHELAREISQYHFGLIPFFHEKTTRLNAKRERGTALKVFNYIEAGLPIIVSNHCDFEKWLAARYGSAIGVQARDLDRLHDFVNKAQYSQLRNIVKAGRKQILLSRHIGRLITFCQDAIANKTKLSDP